MCSSGLYCTDQHAARVTPKNNVTNAIISLYCHVTSHVLKLTHSMWKICAKVAGRMLLLTLDMFSTAKEALPLKEPENRFCIERNSFSASINTTGSRKRYSVEAMCLHQSLFFRNTPFIHKTQTESASTV